MPQPPSLPPTRRDGTVDRLHGVEVPDPYRWLEDPGDPEVAAWRDAQQAVTAPHLEALPDRPAFRDRLAALWGVPRRGVPWRRGERWFQLRNDGSQDQDVLWTAVDHGGGLPDDDRWWPLLDPAAWSQDGSASLAGLAVTDDGSRVAYARSDAGSDWTTWRVVDVDDEGRVHRHDDEITWSKHGGATWLPGGTALLYSAYDPPPAGQDFTATTQAPQLRRHVLGRDPAADETVHADPDEPERFAATVLLHGDRHVVLVRWRGTARTNTLDVADVVDDGGVATVGPWRPLRDREDARYEPVAALPPVDGRTELLVVTDRDEPLGQIVAFDLDDPEVERLVVPGGADRLQSARVVGGDGPHDPAWLVVTWLHHATSRVTVHDPRTGRWLQEVALPELASVSAVAGGRTDTVLHLTVSSFVRADEVWRHDLVAGDTELVTASAVPAPPAPIVTEQVLVHHDGHVTGRVGPSDRDDEVAVPVFVVHRADVAPTGDVPTVLWGYGGFDIPVTPSFRPAWRAWVDAGGVLAVACLRGGGEYGRAWHDAGSVRHRPAVEADALAVAAWLTGDDVRATLGPAHDGTLPEEAAGPSARWSAPGRIGVEGRSNGGLLVGTCLTAAPQRFGSAVPEVGVLDLLRFHRFTVGWAWVSDYGSPEDPDQFPVLRALSPYHRLLDVAADGGGAYPATLVTTADTDDRVVPAHSLKFAAALQAAQVGNAPVRLRVDVAAGHGAGKPVGQLLDERADVLAWHAHHLGLRVRAD